MVSFNGLQNLIFFTLFFFFVFFYFFLKTFIWDNNDINPETLTGVSAEIVSVHCTNDIMVQICTKREAVSINKRGREITRKIWFLSLPNTTAHHVSKKQVDSIHLAQVNLEESIKSALSNSLYINFIWALRSYVASRKSPNWAYFNSLIHQKGQSNHIQKFI